MKTLFGLLIFSCCLLPATSMANGNEPDSLKKSKTATTAAEDPGIIFDLENNIWFQEKVYIHIHDLNERTIVNAAYSREELSQNKNLRNLLRKSSRYMTVDNHYYYYLRE